MKYIGQTTQADVKLRWKQHYRNMINNHSSYLYAAFRKYGFENFDFKIICICFDDACDDIEKQYIERYKTLYPNGYNLEGGGRRTKEIHFATREKIKKALTGKKHPEWRVQKNKESHIGYRHSDNSKQKMSIAHKGKKLSDEAKRNMSKSQQGHFVSELTKQAVTKANSERVWTDEMKSKMSKSIKNDSSRWKSVNQYSKDNIFMNTFKSIKEAADKTNVNRDSIAKVCYGQQKTGGGFIWKFVE
jgi:group I intron endonuclease